MKALTFFKVIFTLLRELRVQRKFNQEYLIPKIKSLEATCDGHFTPEQLFKIKNYYSLFIPTLICSQLKYIYNDELSNTERMRTTLFGILTPLYDDIFDLESLSDSEYKQITLQPNEYRATTFQTKVVRQLQSELILTAFDREAYLNACQQVLEAQIQSKKQSDTNLQIHDLERITFDKGGYSLILYHHLLDHTLNPQVESLLYTTGSAYQLSNDVFDIYKDVRDGIRTLPNTSANFAILTKKFQATISAQNTAIRRLDIASKKMSHLSISLNLVNARTMVALDHLAKSYPSLPPDPFDYWKSKGRHELTIDMEKPLSIIKWIRYSYSTPDYQV